MAYPAYGAIEYSYTAHAQAQGDGTFPGQELDVDLANLVANYDSLNAFVRGITRSDGALANGIVTRLSLAPDIVLGFDAPALWQTGTAYAVPNTVYYEGGFYICAEAHTAGVFATDLAAGKWSLLLNFLEQYYTNAEIDALNAAQDSAVRPQSTGGTGAATLAAAVLQRQQATVARALSAIVTGGRTTPEDHGAVGDGTTDDTAAVQAAIDTGLHVDLLSFYRTTSGLTMTTSGQEIRGQGARTGFKPDAGTYDILTVGTTSAETLNVDLRNFRIWPGGAMSGSSKAIKLVRASRMRYDEVLLGTFEDVAANGDRFVHGLYARDDGAGWGFGHVYITDSNFLGGTGTAMSFGSSVNNASEIYVSGKTFVSGSWAVGVHQAGGSSVRLVSGDVSAVTKGLLVDDAEGLPNRELFVLNFSFDQCDEEGALFDTNGLFVLRWIGGWSAGNTGPNVKITTGQASDARFNFADPHIDFSDTHGFDIADGRGSIIGGDIRQNGVGTGGGDNVHFRGTAVEGWTVVGAQLSKAGVNAAGTDHSTVGDQVYIGANVENVLVLGCDMFDAARHGVRIINGATSFGIIGNQIRQSTAAAISNGTTRSKDRRIIGNVGYDTENFGRATVLSGARTVEVDTQLDERVANIQVTGFGGVDSVFAPSWNYKETSPGVFSDTVIVIDYGGATSEDREIDWVARA